MIVGARSGTIEESPVAGRRTPMKFLTKRTLLSVAALGLALAGGCSDPTELAPPVQETTGLLGNGVFRWVCVTSSDATCGTGVFPTTVALNARFDLEFTGSGDLPEDLAPFTLEPVSPTRLDRASASFEGRLAGDVSVVALGGGYGVDYISLSFRPVDDLLLGEPEAETEPCDDDVNSDGACDGPGGVVSDPEVTLVLGELANVRARAFGEGADLAGAIEYDFETLTPEIVVLTSAVGRRAQLDVRAMGTARISVRAGDYVEVFEYEVQEPPPEPGSTGTGGESEGSDTGIGSGSGVDTGTGSDGDTGSESGGSSGSSGGTGTGTGSESGSGGETDGATTTGGV